jgi:predicted nucleotidyltransferase
MIKINPKYLSAWRRRFDALEAESYSLAAQARADLDEAVSILRKYGATRIFLIGSLCRPNRFHRDSDIDLAVEGISLRDVTRAAADLMMAMEWPTDIKPIEEADEFFRSRIFEKGEILYAEQR